jgi:hypothetical protein
MLRIAQTGTLHPLSMLQAGQMRKSTSVRLV